MKPTEAIQTEGYTYFSIYRGYALYYNPNAEKPYAADKDGQITIFDVGFAEIRTQLDEITGNASAA